MVSQYLQIAGKVLFTGILVLVVAWCMLTIWQLWFNRTLILVPFEYIREGKSAPQVGQHFTQLVNQDVKLLQDLYSGSGGSNDDATDSVKTDATETLDLDALQNAIRADLPLPEIALENVNLPVYSPLGSASGELQPIEIEAFGIQFSTVFKSLSRWIAQPYEIAGSVLESSEGINVYVELRNQPTAVRRQAGQNRWYLSQKADASEASFSVACRLFQVISPIQVSINTAVTDVEFCTMTRALQSYQRYLDGRAEIGNNDEAEQALAEASQLISQLLNRKSRIPFVYKLAAFIYRSEGDIVNAETALIQYLEMLKTQRDQDQDAEVLLSLLRNERSSAEVTVVKTIDDLETQGRIRPVQPGTSVSSLESTAGTICCIVQDSEGIQYVLSADHVFQGSVGTPIIQPGNSDGGQATDQIAEIARTIRIEFDGANHAAGSIARLLPGIEISPEIPGVGKIEGIASEIEIGDTVRIVGRTSGLAEGIVTHIEVSTSIVTIIDSSTQPVRFDGMIGTSKLSSPGDSGAPVLTTDNKLLGIVYAGGSETTLIIPIKPLLEELDVELVQ